ncbi:MAG: F0F1 ATP synthase subunit A [Methanobacteriaceae archaeon]|nr:F0F1 ATP synthase subunit A [Methanobacteriaceae archaeon]HNK90889.1 F0F1 ATP synthase subunit A [Chitinophagales bacterium]
MNSLFNFQPLEQFEIVFLGNFAGIPINNSLIYLIIVYLVIRFLFGLVFVNMRLIPYNLQTFVEQIYNFVFGLVKQQINVSGFAYFPVIFTLFLFILIANLVGMSLYSFTLTSHVTVAFTLSFSFFISIVLVGILIQKASFVNTFIPSGAPKILKPFLIGIEVISYFSRPFSLGIRLFANLMAGHTLLAILANFTFVISKKNVLVTILPFVLIVVIVGLEAMIAVLQAYVFTVLVCIYLNDSIHGSH